MKRHDKFEELFNDALRDHEAKFDPNAWSDLSQRMGPSSPASPTSGLWQKAWPWMAGTGVVAAAITAVVMWPEDKAVTPIQSPAQEVAEQVKPDLVQEDVASNQTLDVEPAELDIKVEGEGVVRIALKEPDAPGQNVVPAMPDKELYEVINEISKDDRTVTNLDKDQGQGPDKSSPRPMELATPVISSVGTVCAGSEVSFAIDNAEIGVSYRWYVDGQEVAQGPFLDASFDKPKGYTVNVVAQKGRGSLTKKTMAEKLLVVQAPNANFSQELNKEGVKPVYEFDLPYQANTKVTWDFGDGTSAKGSDVDHVYSEIGSYEVLATVRDMNGCVSSHREMVHVRNTFNPLVPNAFTPNGDGQNQFLIPMCQEVRDNPFIFTVYDSRTGAVVFQTKNINQPWDGVELATGRVPSRTKIYTWSLRVMGEKNETFNGWVSLMP